MDADELITAEVSSTSAPSSSVDSARDALSNIEAEQMVLGTILLNNESFHRVEDILRAEDFAEALHGRIFDTAAKLIERGHIASPISLAPYFERDPAIIEIGGTDYLARIAAWATPTSIVTDYARLIHSLAVRRGLIDIGQTLIEDSIHADIDDQPENMITEAEKELYILAETGRRQGGFVQFRDALEQARQMAENAYKRDGHLSGISTGLRDLDTQLGGLQPSDLLIVAGRPGMGKTSLATNIAFNVASSYKDPKAEEPELNKVAFYSLEMSAEQLATRIISEQAEIPSSDIRRGKIDENQYRRLVGTIDELQEVPLMIDDTGGLNVAALAARARRQARKSGGLDLIVVDYIQLLSGSDKRRNESRVQEVTEITTSLKALAKELNVPIVALSQLSRAVEQRPDKRPMLSDLRESGSIEQDADVVMFVYRKEYYLDQDGPPEDPTKLANWEADKEAARGKGEVIVAKQRHGPTGDVALQFTAEYTRFGNLAQGIKSDDFNY